MSSIIPLIFEQHAKRVLCTTSQPWFADAVPEPAPPQRRATFVLPHEGASHGSQAEVPPSPPAPPTASPPAVPSPALRRRKSTVAQQQVRSLDAPPCLRNFPLSLRSPYLLLLSLADTRLATALQRHRHLARNFGRCLALPPSDVASSVKATRRACHSPVYVEELSRWVAILRRRVQSFAHLCAYVYEAFLAPPDASLLDAAAARAAQSGEMVWQEFCLPVVRMIASGEATEWGGDKVADVEATEGKPAMPRGPGCLMKPATLGRWITTWLAAWLRTSTAPLLPADVVATLQAVRAEVDRRITRDAEARQCADSHALRGALLAMRRQLTSAPGRFHPADKALGVSRRELSAADSEDDRDWSPLFVVPEVMDAARAYLQSRDLTPHVLRNIDGTCRHMLQHVGLLLSEHGERRLRAQLGGAGHSVVSVLRVLDRAAGDDYGRCARIVAQLLRDRAARRAVVAAAAPASGTGATTVARVTAAHVAAACGYSLRPEHLEHADKTMMTTEELREDTVIEAFEAAIRRPMQTRPSTAVATMRTAQQRQWEARCKVQMRPDDPVLYVAPDSVPTRRATFASTGSSAVTMVTPRPPSAGVTPALARPPRIAKYARTAEQERHERAAAQTVEYVAAQRLVCASLAALEEAAEAPDSTLAAVYTNPHEGWLRRLHPQPNVPAREGLVDRLQFHAAVLRTVKPVVERNSRRDDFTVRPNTVADLRVGPPRPRGPSAVRSTVQARQDSLAHTAQRVAGQREIMERRTLDLTEAGRGSHSVTLAVDVEEMVQSALRGWLDEADGAPRRGVSGTAEPPARATTTAVDNPYLTRFDPEALRRELDAKDPLPATLHHMSSLDVTSMIHKYVC
jgi:hypothetical protein